MKKVTKAFVSVLLVCLMLFSVTSVAFAAGDVGEKIESSFTQVGQVFLMVMTAPLWLPILGIIGGNLNGDSAKADKWADILYFFNPWLKQYVK